MGNKSVNFKDPAVRVDRSSISVVECAAASAYPEEACGLLVGRFISGGRVEIESAVQLPNGANAADRSHRYEMDPRLILHWDRTVTQTGRSIVGFFHSHPDHGPKPSDTDARLAWPSYVYLIAGVTRSNSDEAVVTGIAAWTFDDASTSFRELTFEVEIDPDQIEYYI